MASQAVSGKGTRFRRWNTTTLEWEDIAEVLSINGPDKTRGSIKVTALDSVGGYDEFITGMRDGGNVKLGMNFRRDTYEIMAADFEDDDNQHYEIVLPDSEQTTLEFLGAVTENPLAITVDNQITADVTIKVSGPVVVNSGASSGLT